MVFQTWNHGKKNFKGKQFPKARIRGKAKKKLRKTISPWDEVQQTTQNSREMVENPNETKVLPGLFMLQSS